MHDPKSLETLAEAQILAEKWQALNFKLEELMKKDDSDSEIFEVVKKMDSLVELLKEQDGLDLSLPTKVI